jgi:glycogen debranching enzyme
VQAQLMTPFGVRTLSPKDPDFHARYFEDARGRELGYHEGAVWPWLVGPFLDAWRRVYPHRLEELRALLLNIAGNLATSCVGSISELFDGDAPHLPHGCCAKATSVAELIRLVVALSAKAEDENVTSRAA